MELNVNKQELIELVRRIQTADGTEEEIKEWLFLLKSKVPHPRVANLIYHEDLTAEDVIEKALAYNPFHL